MSQRNPIFWYVLRSVTLPVSFSYCNAVFSIINKVLIEKKNEKENIVLR